MDWRHEPIWDPYIGSRVVVFFNTVNSGEKIVERLGTVTGGPNKIIELSPEDGASILEYRNSLPDQVFTAASQLGDIKNIGPDQLYLIFTAFRELELENSLEAEILGFLNAVNDTNEIVTRIWLDPKSANVKEEGHRRLYLDYFFKTTDSTTGKTVDAAPATTAIKAELAKNILTERNKLTGKQFTVFEELQKVSKLGAVDFHNILYSFAKIPLNSPGDLAALIKTDTWIASLPSGFTELTDFTLADIETTWDAATSSFSNVTFALQGPTPWELTLGEATNPTPILDDVTFYYTIQNPGTPDETITAEMKTVHLAGDVEVPLSVPLAGDTVPAETGDISWNLEQPTTVASLQDVSGLFDVETASLLPEGLLSFSGGVELQALDVSVVDA
ncbi:MAG: hypothetical protein ABUK01_07890 [Leptospirales bacterium]